MFTEKDLSLLSEVFSLARVQTVNSDPKGRQALENVMNFEAIFAKKCGDANTALGFEEKAEASTPVDVIEPEVVQG
mgnify:CR=1 FL=1|tara:strand:+ start:3089 stop:3316 length:228 start_codon:yes stop_codon:yes gene_type:complete